MCFAEQYWVCCEDLKIFSLIFFEGRDDDIVYCAWALFEWQCVVFFFNSLKNWYFSNLYSLAFSSDWLVAILNKYIVYKDNNVWVIHSTKLLYSILESGGVVKIGNHSDHFHFVAIHHESDKSSWVIGLTNDSLFD